MFLSDSIEQKLLLLLYAAGTAPFPATGMFAFFWNSRLFNWLGSDLLSKMRVGRKNTGISDHAIFAALGAAQADAHGALAIGTQGVHLGGSGGAFAGAAQASGQVAGSVLGQGGFAMGQAWVGAGVKAHASVGFGSQGLHFDLGLGAALGIGGYIQVSGNINLEAAGQSIAAIYGTGDHTITGMAGRTVELAASAGAAVSEMASHVAGGIDNAIGNAQDYFSEHAGDNLLHADNVGQFAAGVGEEAGKIGTDAMDATLKPALEAVKEVGHVASEVGSDIAKGKIGDAIEETVEGGAKAAWNGVKDVVDSVKHGFKDFFHGW